MDVGGDVVPEHVVSTLRCSGVDTARLRHCVVRLELIVLFPVHVRLHSTTLQLHTHVRTQIDRQTARQTDRQTVS